MKYGTRKLETYDVLITGCENGGKYHLVRHAWNTEYKLDNGKPIFWDQMDQKGCDKLRDLKTALTLNFTKEPKGGVAGGGASEFTIISVKECNFSWSRKGTDGKDWTSTELKCKGGTNKTTENSNQDNYTLTLSNESFKTHYLPPSRANAQK